MKNNLKVEDWLQGSQKEEGRRVSPLQQSELKQQIDEILNTAIKHKVDIAPEYDDWVRLGFALADGLKEDGYKYFDSFSQLHSNYNSQKTKEQWEKCLNGNGSGVTIKTFFHYAKTNLPNSRETDIKSLSKADFDNVPILLKKYLAYGNTNEVKQIMLTAALASLSGVINNIYAYYQDEKIYPNFYLFVVGKPGSNKGMAKWGKTLIKMIDKYKKSLIGNKRRLFIPADSSSAGFLKLFGQNDGQGILFETEADTIGNMFKQDYGQYDDAFRKAFHHEAITLYRKKDDEEIDIEHPKLSCVLTGTPAQVHNVVSSSENGLFSRFVFLKTKPKKKWKWFNNDDKRDKKISSDFNKIANEVLELYQYFESECELEFVLTDEQLEHFHTEFTRIFEENEITNDENFESSIKRFGLVFFRVSMVLTVLRYAELHGGFDEPIICYQKDYELTWSVIRILMHDTYEVFKDLPEKRHNLAPNKMKLLMALPYEFDRKTFDEIAVSQGLNVKTVEKWLDQFVNDKKIERLAHGHYLNPMLN